jgi:hypothetical protein
LLALGLGFVFSRRPLVSGSEGASFAARKHAITEHLATLAKEAEAGDIGPEFFAAEKARLTDALALVLWEEAQLAEPANVPKRA